MYTDVSLWHRHGQFQRFQTAILLEYLSRASGDREHEVGARQHHGHDGEVRHAQRDLAGQSVLRESILYYPVPAAGRGNQRMRHGGELALAEGASYGGMVGARHADVGIAKQQVGTYGP